MSYLCYVPLPWHMKVSVCSIRVHVSRFIAWPTQKYAQCFKVPYLLKKLYMLAQLVGFYAMLYCSIFSLSYSYTPCSYMQNSLCSMTMQMPHFSCHAKIFAIFGLKVGRDYSYC